MDRFPRSDSIVQQTRSGLQTYMAQVYGWMTVGLLLTAFIAWYAANTPELMMFIFSSKITFFGLIIAQLALVFVLSGLVHKLSAGMATTLFMLYSALTGLTLSSIFIVYTYSSIASTFVVTGGMFGAMSLYGYTTKRDLSGFGSMLFMGLIGIVLASLVNLWLKSDALMWAVTYIGVVLFVGLTAYDTQKLKNIGEQIDVRDSSNLRKYSILGALTLYLDFINLFLMLLRILGNQGFDIADTIIVVIRRKAARFFPERQSGLPRFLISSGLRDSRNAAGGQRHINAVALPDLNNLVIMTCPGSHL